MNNKFETILSHKINKKFPECNCDTCYEEHNYKNQIKSKEKLNNLVKHKEKVKKYKSCIIS